MTRLVWIAPELSDPEEALPALRGIRPAPEPMQFGDVTGEQISRKLVDVIIVDGRGNPDLARSAIEKLRDDTEAPFLIVLDPSDLEDMNFAGASDFVVGSCTRAELEARIGRLTDPHDPDLGDVIRRGDITINRERFEVRVRGAVVDLTFKEFELLQYLAQRPGKVCSRNALLQEVWGYDFFGGTRTVDVHVRRLRAKLGPSADVIETVRNVGYRFAG